MAKQIFIDPSECRKPSFEHFHDIPVNQYQKRMADVRAEFSDQELKDIFHDMLAIRTFEHMLQDLRLTGKYNDVDYNYSGPAHLCIGQECAAVGQAFALDENDFIFGTHRGHGELIAKGLRTLRLLDDGRLQRIMETSCGGEQLRAVRRGFSGSTRELAQRFFMYGIMAEIFGRKTGFAEGLGNSMHAFFIPFGIYPNNAIVGGSAPIATGAALFKKVSKQGGICVANAGDGAVGCGPVWESMNFAAMDQFHTLWEDKGGLPVLFNFVNNGYGMGGQTSGETMGFHVLARIGAGIDPDQMHAERVDGFNVFAVIDAVRRQKALLLKGQGPALLDVVSYRFCGHSTSDANPNRTREEIDAWIAQDALADYERQLLENGVMDAKEIEEMKAEIARLNFEMFKLAVDPEISPRMDLRAEPDAIEKHIFSNQSIPALAEGKPRVWGRLEDNPRWKRVQKRGRFAIQNGEELSPGAVYQIRDAIFEAMLEAFYRDPTLVSFGEDLRDWGSAYGAYKGLEASVPYERLFNAPISESAIISASVGYAMLGGRAAPELMYCDFLGRAGDEVLNQLAKWQGMTAGQLRMPVLVRMGVGSKYGAQHSQDWSSLCAHVPGLKVIYPVTPYDVKGLLNSALTGTDPVMCLECQSLYGKGEFFHEGGVPTDYYEIPIGEPDIKRAGKDLTILTIGPTLYRALDAAKRFQEEFGIECEVIDARSIVPFNYEPVLRSVKKTGRIIIASDACQRGSIINDFAENISQMAFDDLDAPVVVLGARNWITPVYELEGDFFPQADWFLDAFHQRICPLPGYTSVHPFTTDETVRRGRKGV